MIVTIAGLVLVALAIVDEYVTTLSLHGGGPLSGRLVARLWGPAARSGRIGHRVLERYGALMLPVILLTWTLLLYVGWTLVFLGRPEAVVNATTGEPVGWPQRLYFTGYVVTTLGNGELRPGGPLWQAFTVTAAFSGLVLITLAITFVMPVLGAVAHKRQVAGGRWITGLGATTAEILANGWDGRGFSALTTHLANLVPELMALAQERQVYPVLHYFHAPDRSTALAPAIAVLDDALVLLDHGAAPEHRLDRVTMATSVSAVDVLLQAR